MRPIQTIMGRRGGDKAAGIRQTGWQTRKFPRPLTAVKDIIKTNQHLLCRLVAPIAAEALGPKISYHNRKWMR